MGRRTDEGRTRGRARRVGRVRGGRNKERKERIMKWEKREAKEGRGPQTHK